MNNYLWGLFNLTAAFVNLMVIIVIPDWEYIIINYIAFGISIGLVCLGMPEKKD